MSAAKTRPKTSVLKSAFVAAAAAAAEAKMARLQDQSPIALYPYAGDAAAAMVRDFIDETIADIESDIGDTEAVGTPNGMVDPHDLLTALRDIKESIGF